MIRLAAPCLLVAAACGGNPSTVDASLSGPDGSQPDARVESGRAGGTIAVFAEPEGFGMLAEFYDAATPDPGTALTTGDGHCDVRPPLPTVTVVDRDIGASFTATGDLGTMTAMRDANSIGLADFLLPQVDHTGPTFYYFASDGIGMSGFSSTWTITTDAGPLATITVPDLLIQADSMIIHTAGEPATVNYKGGAGAQYLEILLSSDGGTARCYPPLGTSFTVPAAVLDAIVIADTAASVNVFAYNREVVTLGGRDVIVAGVSQNLD